MEDLMHEPAQYQILATCPRADEQTRVLKYGETFAIFNHFGDILPGGLGEEGIYHAPRETWYWPGIRSTSCAPCFSGKTSAI
jgi:hypothetical protein